MAGLDKIVTDDLVFEVADRLTAEGRTVSNRMVWSEIGGGSMTTIANAVRRWRERQQLRAEPPAVRVALPEAVANVLRDAAGRLWAAAQEETQREIDRLTETANARVAEASAERDSALAELQSTAEELQAAQGTGAASETALAAVRQEGEGLRAELARTAERAGQAETRVAEIERRAEDFRTELARVHDDARAERERQAEAAAAAQAALDTLREELTTLKATTQAERQEHAAADQRMAQQIEQLSGQLAITGNERDDARRSAAEARETAAHLQGRVEAMTAQQAELLQRVTPGRVKKGGDDTKG